MSNYSFCEKCGKPLSENTRFCPECGWKVPTEAVNTDSQVAQNQPEPVAAGSNSTYAANSNTNPYSSNPYAGNPYQGNQQFQPNQQFQGNPQYQSGQQFQNQFPNNQQYPGNPYPGNNYPPNNYPPKAKKSSAPIIITVIVIALLAIAAVLYFVVLKPGSGIKAEQLNGSWSGSLTVTDYKGEDAPSSADLKKSMPLTGEMDISSSGKGDVTLELNSDPEGGTVTYSGGDIKMVISEDGDKITFDGSVKKSGGEYVASGKFSGSNGEITLKGTWKLTKHAK